MEFSIFVDESGDTGIDSEFYLLTLVFHDQAASLQNSIAVYEGRLKKASLSNIPFHMEPLMGGEGDYSTLSIEDRAKMLSYFHEFAVRCPVRHKTFIYEKKDYGLRGDNLDANVIAQKLFNQMDKDIQAVLREHLVFFQRFDKIKIYYDRGQKPVRKALNKAFAEVISAGVVDYKADVRYRKYRLCQIADMFCGFALLETKFSRGIQTATDELFADDYKNLRKRFLKKINKLSIDRIGLE